MSSTVTTLESLTAALVEKVAIVSYHLGKDKLALPTLEEAGHASYKGESAALRKARFEVASLAKSLLLLSQGPEDTVQSIAWSAIDAAILDVLLRFKLYEAVPLESQKGITLDDLAKAVDLPADKLERIVRFAVCNGIFAESEPGVFVHSAASAALAHSSELCAVGRMAAGPLTQMEVRMGDALDLQQALRKAAPRKLINGQSELGPEDPAFCLAFPGWSGPFELGAANEEFATIGHGFMKGLGSTDRLKNEHLIQARDWSSTGNARVVDIGGSLGPASIALASALPDATFVVTDFHAEAMEHGRALADGHFPQLAPRLTYVQYDFFTPIPAELQGDVFLLQWVLHDWNDADALRIIKNLVPGLRPGARVLIAEAVRPAPPARLANTLDEKLVLYQDMTMLAAHNSKERTIAEFIKIFEEADARFQYVTTGGGAGGAYRSLIEFEFRENKA